jgi:phage terminase large subunit
MAIVVKFTPETIGGGYGAFWKCKKRYRVVKGGKASKKSTTAAIWYIVNMMKPEYGDANLLVVRATFNTHSTSTFAQLRWAINRIGANELWKATTNPLQLVYKPTGQKILFRGFDDWQKLASTTVDKGYLCWVWIEEAFELVSEENFEKFDLSVPRGDVPKPLFKQTTITFNPWSEKHWLKKRFFDNPRNDTFTSTTNYLCNEFLDETDREIYERMKEDNPRRYAVAGLGEWGISDGLIYENWVVEPFDKSNIGGEDAWKFKHVFGLDYGYTNDPTAFIAMAVNPIDKVLYIYDEHYETRMLNSDIAAMIVKKGFQKERIIADSAEPKSNDDLRRLGVTRIQPARKGKDSILNGISRLQEYKMIVHPDCKNVIMELSSYIWGKTKDDEVRNKPIDKNNHLMDAMRYSSEDTIFFKAEKRGMTEQRYKKLQRMSRFSGGGSIRPSDFKGGWG